MLKQVPNLTYVDKQHFNNYDAVLVIATGVADAAQWVDVPGHQIIADLAKVNDILNIFWGSLFFFFVVSGCALEDKL